MIWIRHLKKEYFVYTLFSHDILDIAINIRDRLRKIEILRYLGRIDTVGHFYIYRTR